MVWTEYNGGRDSAGVIIPIFPVIIGLLMMVFCFLRPINCSNFVNIKIASRTLGTEAENSQASLTEYNAFSRIW